MSEEEQELIKNCKIWIDEEDINYTRWFGLNELAILIKVIENLRIKNGKEFARGMETNEKLWRTKIEAKIKELERKKQILEDNQMKDKMVYTPYQIVNAEILRLKELLGE